MKIFIWGAGGQGRIVLDILKQNKDFEIHGFIDNDKKFKDKIIDGAQVLGDEKVLTELKKKGITAGIVAIGDNQTRRKIANYLKKREFRLVNAIHPRSVIASNVLIGNNVTIAAGALVCAHTIIKDSVIINTGAIVEHENIIGEGAHIAPGAKLAGHVEIGEETFVGIGSVIIECLKVGNNSIIGAGSIVLKDIPNNVIAVGVPVRIIKKIK